MPLLGAASGGTGSTLAAASAVCQKEGIDLPVNTFTLGVISNLNRFGYHSFHEVAIIAKTAFDAQYSEGDYTSFIPNNVKNDAEINKVLLEHAHAIEPVIVNKRQKEFWELN